MESLIRLHAIANDPTGYARQWQREHGGKIVGHFCSYTPDEIILAAGALGFRLFGGGAAIAKADTHLQAYSCSLVRGALEEVLSGRLDFIDGVVFPHTCDAIQRLSDIWRMNVKSGFHLDLVLPVKLHTASAREYMQAVLAKFKRDLEAALAVDITTEDLRAAMVTCDRIRQAVERINRLRRQAPGIISGTDFQAMAKAGMVMERRQFLTLVEDLGDQLEAKRAQADRAEKPASKPIVLAGGLCNMPDLYGILEAAGAHVVADDLCTGSRFYQGRFEVGDDPMQALAHRYTRRNPCPAKHTGIRSRGQEILSLVSRSGAKGVVFVHLKFCDPHAFDYPYLKEMLAESGTPSMLYEMEAQPAADGQFQTRVEAFIEILK